MRLEKIIALAGVGGAFAALVAGGAACTTTPSKTDAADAAAPIPTSDAGPAADAAVDAADAADAGPSGPGHLFFSLGDVDLDGGTTASHVYSVDLSKKDATPTAITKSTAFDDELQDVSADGTKLVLLRKAVGSARASIVVADTDGSKETTLATCDLLPCRDARIGSDGNVYFLEESQTGTLLSVPLAGGTPVEVAGPIDSRCQRAELATMNGHGKLLVSVVDAIGLGCPSQHIGLWVLPLDTRAWSSAIRIPGLVSLSTRTMSALVGAPDADRVYFEGTLASAPGDFGLFSFRIGDPAPRRVDDVGETYAVGPSTLFLQGRQGAASYVRTVPLDGADSGAGDIVVGPTPDPISNLVWSR